MPTFQKEPVDPQYPAQPPVRYQISVRAGTYAERLQRAGLKIGQWWAEKFPVDPAFTAECWTYVLRLPTFCYVTDLTEILRPLRLTPARIEHLLGFAECHPEEVVHMPLMATATYDIVPFADSWKLPVYPALKPGGCMGAIGVEYKDYNKYGDKWIEDDVSVLCVKEEPSGGIG